MLALLKVFTDGFHSDVINFMERVPRLETGIAWSTRA